MKLVLTVIAAALLFTPTLAQADSSCLCSVGYVVRPCGGTLTKTAGPTAKARYRCHKASTKLAWKKDRSRRFASEGQCRAYCTRFGKQVIADLEDGPICRARPRQNIITKWNAYFGGERPIRDRERKSHCPARD